MSSPKIKKHVVVVGGGFGGIKAALELARNNSVAVTLVSDQPDFRYNPTLYHTATGGLMRQSSIPLTGIFKDSPIMFMQDQVTKIDRVRQLIKTFSGQALHYDTIIFALGNVTNYFGIPGLDQYSYGITSPGEVKRFKNHLHTLLEDRGKPDLNYLIVGGGPTGIELAGALPAYLRQIMQHHGIKSKRLRIKLIEAAPRLLPRSAPNISSAVEKRLKKLGVQLSLGKGVEGELIDGLMVGGKKIMSQTVVWAAGTANNPFFKVNNFTLTDRGKVIVDDHMLAEKNIYVIGDNANTPYSGMAQTALYDGHYVAHDIEAKLHENVGPAYKPRNPPSVIPVGPGWAAFQYGKFTLVGRFGWYIRQAADWIGYHDLEPWWKASSQWMTEFGEEEDCPVCAKHNT
jgi:NADH:quinone reductase (non-electrogenic)